MQYMMFVTGNVCDRIHWFQFFLALDQKPTPRLVEVVRGMDPCSFFKDSNISLEEVGGALAGEAFKYIIPSPDHEGELTWDSSFMLLCMPFNEGFATWLARRLGMEVSMFLWQRREGKSPELVATVS
jgi:hypothetical protein